MSRLHWAVLAILALGLVLAAFDATNIERTPDHVE